MAKLTRLRNGERTTKKVIATGELTVAVEAGKMVFMVRDELGECGDCFSLSVSAEEVEQVAQLIQKGKP